MKLFYFFAFISLSFCACTDEMDSLNISDSTLSSSYFSSPDASYYLLSEEGYILLEWEKLNLIRMEWIKSVETLGQKAATEKFGEQTKSAVILEVYPDKLEMALTAAAN